MAEGAQDRKFIDLTEPFLAIRGSERIGYHEIRLVNPTDADLVNVVIKTGGWVGADEDGVLQSTADDKLISIVPAHDAVRMEEPDDDELGDFVIWWKITYAGREAPLDFSLFKNSNRMSAKEIPVVGKSWLLIPRYRKA
jgi:hypothetical protein